MHLCREKITEVAYVACESLSRHLFKVHLFELAFEWIQAFRNALRIDNCDDNRKISYKQNERSQWHFCHRCRYGSHCRIRTWHFDGE